MEEKKIQEIKDLINKIYLYDTTENDILILNTLRNHYSIFMKNNIKYLQKNDGISFLQILISYMGRKKVSASVDLLKRIADEQKFNEPSLSKLANNALENIKND